MPLFLVIFAQVVSAVPPERIDLTIPQPCTSQTGQNDEIVVCGNRGDGSSPYRINQPPAPQKQLPKAEVQLANGASAGAETESVDVGGFPSNRLMLRLKLKF